MSEFARYAPSAPGSVARRPLEGAIIRAAAEPDLDDVAAIAAAREGEEIERWRARMERLLEESRDADRSMLLVAAGPEPGVILGYGKASRFTPPPGSLSNAAPEGWYLTGLVIRPEFRRRGVGSDLTRARLERIARTEHAAFYFANATNPATIDLHRAFGFVEVSRDFWMPGVSFTGGVGILFRCDLSALAPGGAGPTAPAGHALPDRIVTPRLVLRCYRVSDAPALKRAIDENLEHLRPWMPWALEEPSSVEAIEARLAGFAASFAARTNWVYGMFAPDETRVIGGAGLHPRIGEGGLEIGYWVDAGETGRGLATEAADALTAAAFGRPDIDRVEIRCDPRNAASAGVPRRLGYRLVEVLRGNAFTATGAPRDTMVWRMARDEWAARIGGPDRTAPSTPGTQGPAPS